MSKVELVMPKMGESIIEATILKWTKKVGDKVEQDETLLEIATDKVDSEVPSPVSGVIEQILFEENAVVAVGKVIAIISTEAHVDVAPTPSVNLPPMVKNEAISRDLHVNMPSNGNGIPTSEVLAAVSQPLEMVIPAMPKQAESNRFYSPLVRTIAKQEQISMAELDRISGSGDSGRVTKNDILNFIEHKKTVIQTPISTPSVTPSQTSVSGNVEIIEMDRMRQLIAAHMVRSKQTSPHVTSFVEADVTNIVSWRTKIKGQFQAKYGENITFTPIFVEAICKALRDFPMVNSSVEGTKIIIKKDLNIGMAAALPSGNLIVPVIKNADMMNLAGLTKSVNGLADAARKGKLKPDDTQNGTFTLTNVGSFGNLMGTPIINQPQAAILATGAIKKKPAVLETEFGDVIAIRHMMFLSLSYDHRIVDGALGGSFLRRVADYLEQFDVNRSV